MESAEDRHHDGLSFSSFLGAIAIRVFPGNDGRTDHTFSMVVIGSHFRMLQKGEEFVLMSSQAFHQPKTLAIFPRLANELSKAIMEEMTSFKVTLWRKLRTTYRQPEGILDEAFEFLCKAPPLQASMKDTGADHVPQQMKETPLFKERVNLVVGSEEITDQDAFKHFPQHLFKDGRGPRRADQIVNDLVVGEAPKPIGFPEDSPSGFIDMEEGASSGQHPQEFVPGQEDLGEPLPGKGKAPWGDTKIETAMEIGNDLSQRNSEIKVQVSGLDQQMNPDGAFGEGILHRGFDSFTTFRAIVDLNDMFGDGRFDLGDVFGKALPGRDRLSQGRKTLRAVAQGVGFCFIDSFGRGPSGSWMSLLSARSLLATLGRRLFIGSLHSGGSGRIFRERFLGYGLLQLFHPTVQFKELFNGGLFSQTV